MDSFKLSPAAVKGKEVFSNSVEIIDNLTFDYVSEVAQLLMDQFAAKKQDKIVLVFTDPPYGIDVVQSNQVGGGGETKFKGKIGGNNFVESKTYSKIIGDNTTETAKKFYELCININLKNFILWGGNYFTDFLLPSRCWIIWDKEMTGNFSEAEMGWTSFNKGGVKIFKHLWNGLSRKGNRKDDIDGI